jgi:putative transposase
MCSLLNVSRSGYYAWRGRPPSARSRADARLTERIREIHAASYKTYGAPRIHAALCANGTRTSRKRVARLMRVAGLHGSSRRRYQPSPVSRRTEAPSARGGTGSRPRPAGL